MSTINVNNVMPVTGETVNINGVTITNGVLSATTYDNIPTISFTGGTVEGAAEFIGGLTASTISATTYENLPNFDFTGGTVEGFTEFTAGLNAGTISATTYENLPVTQFTGGTVDGFTDFTNGLLTTTMSATTFYGDGSNLTGISGGTASIIEVTKIELDVLISANDLVAGATYKITGVDMNLYSGTTIFLKALTNNELTTNGNGIFYNPKYFNSSIYNNTVSYNIIDLFGNFTQGETIVSDTGAVGYLLTYGMVNYVSGDWSGSTTVSGISSTASATIDNVLAPFYDLGDDVIWGGKKWVNVSGRTINVSDEVIGVGIDGVGYCFDINNTPINQGTLVISDGVETFTGDTQGVLTGDLGGYGNINYVDGTGCMVFASPVLSGTNIVASYTSTGIGYAMNNYNLSDMWEVVPFNETDYDVVLDEIEYDIKHDIIIKRKDKFNNEVSGNYQVFSEFEFGYELGNPIKDFQWGSGNDNWSYGRAIYYFSDELDDNNGINDGGDDMYDGANEIYTNLGNVPYTETRLTFEPDGGVPAVLFPKDGQVVSGDTYFGVGSEYFTNLYPGLFVLYADNISITYFEIDGGIGADGDGNYEVDEYVLTGFSSTYKVFVKKVYDSGDPSINHIMIVDTDDVNIVHEYDIYNEDDFDKIDNLSGATKVYYLLTSVFGGNGYITKNEIDSMVNTFIGLVDGKTATEALSVLNNSYETITNILPPARVTLRTGVMSNSVIDSYFDCLNFNGGYIWGNNLQQYSRIYSNVFSHDLLGESRISENNLTHNSVISNNYVSNSSNISSNHLTNFSYINNNRLNDNSDIDNNELFDDSTITNNDFNNNADLRKNKLSINSSIDGNSFKNSDGIYLNVLVDGSRIDSNISTSSRIEENQLNTGSLVTNNTLIDSNIEANNLDIRSEININTLTGSSVNENVMSTFSVINYNTLNSLNNATTSIKKCRMFTSNVGSNILLDGSLIEENDLFGSNISTNQIGAGGGVKFNKMTKDSFINNNNLLLQAYVQHNVLNNSSGIANGNFATNARVEYCTLSNQSEFELSQTPQLALDIRFIESNHGSLFGDLTNATNVFANVSKTLVTKSNGENILIYIDTNNVQQIVATNS